MAMKNPQEVADKWARNLGNAAADMRSGVNRVETAPGQLAANKADKMRAGILAALDSGKWQRRVSSVSLQEWRTAYIDKGIPRIQSGATAGKPKMAAYMSEALPVISGLQQTVRNMPSNTIQESLERVRVFMEGMHEFGNNR